MVKRLPTMWETQVRSLGGEDPLVKEMATHSTILAWKNINNLRYADDTTLMVESEEELKKFLYEGERGE